MKKIDAKETAKPDRPIGRNARCVSLAIIPTANTANPAIAIK